MVTSECSYCRQNYTHKSSHTRTNRYCSDKCRRARWTRDNYARKIALQYSNYRKHRKPKPCSGCGRTIPDEERTFGKRFCSEACHLKTTLQPGNRRRSVAWERRDPRGRLRNHIHHLYGMTLAQYDALLDQQAGSCAICKTKVEDITHKKGIGVDHDHKTGKVRGLLCGYCNHGIGMFRDNPQLCQNAATYLEQTKG